MSGTDRPTRARTARRRRRAGRRRRHHRHLPAVPRARSRVLRAAARGRRRRGRHLVLEPLPRRAVRLRELHVRVPVLEGAVRRVGVAGALRRAAGDRALPQPRGRPVRPAPPHALRRHGHRPPSTTRRPGRGRWWSATAPSSATRFLVAATGVLSVPFFPDVAGPRRLPRRAAPHRAVAGDAGRLRGQARRRHRHRIERRAAHPRDRRRGRLAHRVPAHRQLVHAAQQRADHRRGAGAAPGRLRGDARDR